VKVGVRGMAYRFIENPDTPDQGTLGPMEPFEDEVAPETAEGLQRGDFIPILVNEKVTYADVSDWQVTYGSAPTEGGK